MDIGLMHSLPLLVLGAGLAAMQVSAADPAAHARAEAARARLDERGALRIYEEAVARDSSDLEALWNASYLASSLGTRSGAKDPVLAARGAVLADAAVRRFPQRAEARFAKAVSVALNLDASTPSKAIEQSRVLRRWIGATLEKDPGHPGAHYLLGRWRLAYATLNPVKALAVRALLGGIPEEATLEGAEAAFRKALERRPREPLYHLDLAETLVEQGRRAEAVAILRGARDLPPLSEADKGNLRKIRSLLNELDG